MEVRYEHLNQVTVLGIEVITTIQGGKNHKDCPALWEKLCPMLASHNISFEGKRTFGISYCLPDDPVHFRYVAGVEYWKGDIVPEGMKVYTIPESRYAVFTHVGSVATIGYTFDLIHRDWDVITGGKKAKDYEFELYNEDFRPDSPDCKTYIYAPLAE